MPSGYSGTPLARKLGLKPGIRAAFLSIPPQYESLLEPIPAGIRHFSDLSDAPYDFIHFFTKSREELETIFPELKAALKNNGTLWISWPKKAAKVETDLDENIIRKTGLAIGLVDVKVCAIDSTWSGLKFVYRLRDRKPL